MANRVFVDSCDEYLTLRLRVLCARGGLSLCESADDGELSLIVRDLDFPSDKKDNCQQARVLTVSRNPAVAASIHLPIKNELLARLLRGEREGARLCLDEKERCAVLDGRRIRLTEVEAALLSLLIEAEGECVSHGEAVSRIWSDEVGCGTVNVYIHYLREKLERSGERIILAKRGRGYAIDKKFLKEDREC